MCGMYGVDVSDVDDAWAILHASVYVCVYIYTHTCVHVRACVPYVYMVWCVAYGLWCMVHFVFCMVWGMVSCTVWSGAWHAVGYGAWHGREYGMVHGREYGMLHGVVCAKLYGIVHGMVIWYGVYCCVRYMRRIAQVWYMMWCMVWCMA